MGPLFALLLAVAPAVAGQSRFEAPSLRLELVVRGLSFPTQVTNAGDNSGRLFVLEEAGRIRIIQEGRIQPTPFLDISHLVRSGELQQGLAGVALHARFQENGWFYVNYTDLQGDVVVARYRVSSTPDEADPDSPQIILTIPQPSPNLNGGLLVFGPDGYLWIGTDGGGPGPEIPRSQDLALLNGKLLRIDVDAAFPYAIPPGNPFLDLRDARAEIWAWGLRNPWRFAFDRATGELYIADVGQDAYESLYYVPPGSPGGMNFGWPIVEGIHCLTAGFACERTDLQPPIAGYDHMSGCAVVGGVVHSRFARNRAASAYLLGDFCTGRVWALARGREENWGLFPLQESGPSISSFGEDEQGQLYVTAIREGAIYRLVFS